MKWFAALLWLAGIWAVQMPMWIVVEKLTGSVLKAWLASVSMAFGVTALFWSTSLNPFKGF